MLSQLVDKIGCRQHPGHCTPTFVDTGAMSTAVCTGWIETMMLMWFVTLDPPGGYSRKMGDLPTVSFLLHFQCV